MAFLTHYWSWGTCSRMGVEIEDMPFDHTFGEEFIRLGVSGDQICSTRVRG